MLDDIRQRPRAGNAVRRVRVCAERLTDAVTDLHADVGHAAHGDVRREEHVVARLEIIRVLVGVFQVEVDHLHRLDAQRVAVAVRLGLEEALDRVRHRVQTGRAGHLGRQRHGDGRVKDGVVGHELVAVARGDLALIFHVVHDGGEGHLRAGAGGRRDADERDARVGVQLRADRRGVIAAGAGVGDEHARDLCGIHAAAAADGDADIGTLRAAERGGLFDGMHGRLDLYLIINDAGDAVGLERLDAGVDDAGRLDIGAMHDEGFAGAELLCDIADFLAAANAVNDLCNEKLKFVLHKKHPF